MLSGDSPKCEKSPNALLFDYHDAIKDLPGATPYGHGSCAMLWST